MAPAWLWLVARAFAPGCSGVRVDSNGRVDSNDPVLRYAPRSSNEKLLSVWRQGIRIAPGPIAEFEFTGNHFHKEYIIDLNSSDDVVFVSNGDLCGVGAFTQRELTCTPLSRDTFGSRVNAVSVQPPTDRSFGVELEFVVRHSSHDAWRSRTSFPGLAVAGPSGPSAFDEVVYELHKTAAKHAAVGLHGLSADELIQIIRSRSSVELVEGIIQQDEVVRHLLETVNNVVNFPLVKECFNAAASKGSGNDMSCGADKDCDLGGYCNTKRGQCKPRKNCGVLDGRKRGECPVDLDSWGWTSDISVRPLTASQADSIDSGHTDETLGIGLELVSPILSGKKGMESTLEIVTLLQHLGVQAGPSQGLHVHINVLGEGVRIKGDKLSLEGIGRVWVAWVKYQLVLDEFLSPSRLGTAYSHYSRRLFLGRCGDEPDSEASCASNPCPCVRTAFKQMHNAINQMKADKATMSADNFCNAVLSRPGSENPCAEGSSPHQRYFQVNLAKLHEFGTIEFRAHSATYDLNRIARWVRFLLIFVERFGNTNEGDAAISTSFFDKSAEEDLDDLVAVQRNATLQNLWNELGDLIDDDTKKYYMERQWEKDDPLCSPRESHGLLEYKAEIPGEVEKIFQTAADVRLNM